MSLVNCTRYYLSTIYRDYDIVDFVVKQSAAMIFSRELDSSIAHNQDIYALKKSA